MSGIWTLQIVTYVALVVLVLGLVAKAASYARAPLHLRWEIYPIPGERGKSYGGSYMEESNWWSRPHSRSRVGELRAMLAEILLVRSLWHHNRRLWYVSYPFHAGIYLIVVFVALLFVGALAETFGTTVSTTSAAPFATIVAYLTIVAGVVGSLGVAVGSIGLLVRRLSDEEVRRLSTPGDFFNLVFILAIALSALIAWVSADSGFALARAYVRGIVTFSPAEAVNGTVVMGEMLLLSLFFIYLPFTHMTHFVAKYFTYHMVRWDDRPNVRGGALERRVKANLVRPVSWSAAHIGGRGNWAEVATSTESLGSRVQAKDQRCQSASEVNAQ